MNQYKVSVILPVYNVELYLQRCLDSLFNQTLDSIEIIVVNDGSTDSSLEILMQYQDRIYLINQENQGLSAARNAGIQVATGRYLVFIDSDDFIDCTMLERLYNVAEKSGCPLVICDAMLYKSNLKVRPFNRLKMNEKKIYNELELLQLILNGRLQCQVFNKLYRRDVWNNYDLRFEEGRYYEDILIVIKVIKAYQRAMFINDTLYFYCLNERSITATIDSKKLDDLMYAIQTVMREVSENSTLRRYLYNFESIYGMYYNSLRNRLDVSSKKQSYDVLRLYHRTLIAKGIRLRDRVRLLKSLLRG